MFLRPLLRSLFCLFLALPLAARGPGRHVQVAAAADLKWALEDLKQAFARTRPDLQIRVTFGSSGQFYAQLTQRAPFDLFLSADLDYARRLADQGLGRPGSLFKYGVGRLVLWVPAGSPLNLALGLAALNDPAVKHVAMANPTHAPYGRAAQAALDHAGLRAGLQSRLVLGENVGQAAQFVQTGAAEAGLLALSLAMAPEMRKRGQYWTVPQGFHPPLVQGGLVLGWAQDPEAAQAFKSFLLSPQGVGILRRFGFEPAS